MKGFGTRIIAYTSLSHALVHIFELTYPAVLVLVVKEFQAGEFAAGMVAMVFGFAFGLTALPAGFLVDRVGSKRIIVLMLLGAGIASVGVGLSPNIYVLGFALGIMGLVTGLYHPAGMSLIARSIEKPQLAFAYHGMVGNVGVAMAPLLAGGIASLLWGWRASYIMIAIPAIVLAVLLSLSSVPGYSQREMASSGRSETVKERLSRRTVVSLAVLSLGWTFLGFIYRGAITFLPLYIAERVRFSIFNIDATVLAGFFVTVALLFGILGQYAGGHLARKVRVELAMILHAVFLAAALLAMGVSDGGPLVASACLFAFIYYVGQPVYNTVIATYSPRWFQGRAFGISFFCSFGLGATAAAFGGYIAERAGVNWVFISLAGFTAFMLLSGVIMIYRSRASSPSAVSLTS